MTTAKLVKTKDRVVITTVGVNSSYIYINLHAHACIYTHAHTHTYMHPHTHTHTMDNNIIIMDPMHKHMHSWEERN